MLPSFFAMIATLGTLNLMGRPLDIPGLMLSIIVFGLGIDFSIFYVRSFQRYGTLDHPAFSLIRMAVFLSAVATLFGFGAMWGADHSLLRSTGITAFLGIAYSMLGSFLILPALLGRIGRRRRNRPSRRGASRARPGVGALPAHGGLPAALRALQDATGPDVRGNWKRSCVPWTACGRSWMSAPATGCRPAGCWNGSPRRRSAGSSPRRNACGSPTWRWARAGASRRGAPRRSRRSSAPVDLCTMIDMVHFLTDAAAALTLSRVRARMRAGALLIVRASLTPTRRLPWSWWAQNLALRAAGVPVFYRPLPHLAELVAAAGFRVERTLPSGPDGELVWLVGRKA